MQVFDFTNGTKGRHIGDVTISGVDCRVKLANGETCFVDQGRYKFCEFMSYWVGNPNKDADACEHFFTRENIKLTCGVEAICFCWVTGKNTPNPDFEWFVVASRGWLNRHFKTLKITK